MTTEQIKTWIAYWTNGKMVNFDAIRAFEHVYQARQYCQCMRVGVFHDVSDLAIWRALREMRGE